MRPSRREFLLATGAAGLATRSTGAWGEEPVPAPAAAGPPALTAQTIKARLPGTAEDRDVLSFDGTVGGPVLRVAKGSVLDVRLVNRLERPLSLQWQGLRGANALEGNWPLAGDSVAAGTSLDLRLVPPDSGLLWFHPAAVPGQPDLTAAGLRGVLVVEETMPPAVDRDVVLAVAEWHPAGPGGPAVLTVNGAAAPARLAIVPGGRLRLRIVNATTTRAMILGLDGARPLIVAIDGQPSDLFEPVRDSVPVGPGARFEFMIDLPREQGALLRVALRGGAEEQVLFEARTDGIAREPLPPIAALPRNPLLAPAIPLEKSARADLRIEAAEPPVPGKPARWRVNGTASLDLGAAPLLRVRQGASVTLGFDNRSAAVVPLRVHGHVMRLLHAKDDGWEPYWRDSVILLPGSISHVAFVADNPGRWLIESALFDQAAFGLRSWFEVA